MAESDKSKIKEEQVEPVEEIEYSPEELSEIGRVSQLLDSFNYAELAIGENGESSEPTEPSGMGETRKPADGAETFEDEESEPEDLGLPVSTLDSLNEQPEPADLDLPESNLEIVAPPSGGEGAEFVDVTNLIQDMGDISDVDVLAGIPELNDEPTQPSGPKFAEESAPDISDLLDTDGFADEEPPAASAPTDDLAGLTDFAKEVPEPPEVINEEILAGIPEIADEEPPIIVPSTEVEPPTEAEEPEEPESERKGLFPKIRKRKISTEEELRSLLKDEPESLDDSEISRDKHIFVDANADEYTPEPESQNAVSADGGEDVPVIDVNGDDFNVEDIPNEPTPIDDIPESKDVPVADVPADEEIALTGFDLGESSETDGGALEDEASVAAGELDFSPEDITPSEQLEETDASLASLMSELGDIPDDGTVLGESASEQVSDLPDLGELPADNGDDIGGFSASDSDSDFGLEEINSAPMNFEEPETVAENITEDFGFEPPISDDGAAAEDSSDIELSDRDLKKLKRALLLFNPGLRRAVTDAVVNDKLSPADTKSLIDSILKGLPEERIAAFLEGLTGEKVPETGVGGRKVIHSRPEYMKKGRERQKLRLKMLGIAAAALVVAFILTIVGYQYVYKPAMAKSKIDEGKELILRPGDYAGKTADFKAAEDLADEVERRYKKEYIYGYNEYGMAYLKQKDYSRAYYKLNTAYKIDAKNKQTLLNLGKFYAKAPAAFYSTVKGQAEENYYSASERKGRDISQLDLAINFYRRVLLLEPNETTALYGIGNAYFAQGQYLQAKNFYMDILKVDPKSAVGYSGLLNLYIDRDAYDLVAATHTEIRYKKIMADVPLPLLAKLANYYLDKNKTSKFNVRIDYGVQSPRLKDIDDNTYPAVQNVISVMNSVDSSYPPLMLVSARMNLAQNNIMAARRYLERALAAEPNYFDALHLMGKFAYETNQPVEAYEYLNRAASSVGKQPAWTEEDFYKGTENIGETYSVLGNIFYYYFDKVKYRFGSLEDEILDAELEKMANYNTAKEKYLAAVKEGFASAEVRYNLGRICYLNKQYDKSLEQWLYLYDDFASNPELMLALGNAFYHLGQYDASRGEFLKMINVLEHESDGIRVVNPNNKEQVRLFKAMSSAYNNLGAVYHLRGEESKSSVAYWKSIDYAQRLDVENEFARVNLARSINGRRSVEPILDENVPYSIKFYTSDMR